MLLLCLVCTPARAEFPPLDTPHYRIHTDLEPRLAEDLAVRMEAMYSDYAQRLADFDRGTSPKMEVYLFKQRKDYAAFTNDRFPNTGGVFLPRRNLLAAFLEPQGRDALRRTLQHEAFHQFAFTSIGSNLPVWLNEGLAQVFEEGVWTGRQFMIGQVPPRRIRQLKHDIDNHRLMPFRQFLAMSDEQWNADLADANLGAARYGQAWAMTHFLVFDKDENDQYRYRSRLISMLRKIHAGKKPGPAFVESFSDNYAGFEQRFLQFAAGLEPTREARLIEQQSVLADMLVMMGDAGDRFDDVAAFRQKLTDGGYRLRYTKGNVQWSTEPDPASYFRDIFGRPMTSEQLYFSPRSGAPFPDIICSPADGLRFRTVFHSGLERVDHETIIEAIQ
jgi:hypothetical protein